MAKKCEAGRCLDPLKDLKINDMDYVSMLKEMKEMEDSMEQYGCIQCPAFEKHVSLSSFFT